jgi:hypothetical protein
VSSLSYLFGEPTYVNSPPAPLDLAQLEAGLPSHRVSRVKDGANPVLPHDRGLEPVSDISSYVTSVHLSKATLINASTLDIPLIPEGCKEPHKRYHW